MCQFTKLGSFNALGIVVTQRSHADGFSLYAVYLCFYAVSNVFISPNCASLPSVASQSG